MPPNHLQVQCPHGEGFTDANAARRPSRFITGAPGSGKSTALEHFLRRGSGYIAFDMDWLLGSASALAQCDVQNDPDTWPAYNALWLEILRAVYANGVTPVLFAPLSPSDLPRVSLPAWSAGVSWLLLDCPDEVREARLAGRAGWTGAMIAEAMADARALRAMALDSVDTAAHSPEAVADQILSWLSGPLPAQDAP